MIVATNPLILQDLKTLDHSMPLWLLISGNPNNDVFSSCFWIIKWSKTPNNNKSLLKAQASKL